METPPEVYPSPMLIQFRAKNRCTTLLFGKLSQGDLVGFTAVVIVDAS